MTGDTTRAAGCPPTETGEDAELMGDVGPPGRGESLLALSGGGDKGRLTFAGLMVPLSSDDFGCSWTWLNLESGLDIVLL